MPKATVSSACNMFGEQANHRMVDRVARDPAAERQAVVAALRRRPAAIAPKYLYDRLGCALFGAICELPEYYPTRTEQAIFSMYRPSIVRCLGQGKQFVDLGAGDCRKARQWLPFIAPARYVAVDIARDEIDDALARIAPDFPHIDMQGVVADFTCGLDLSRDLTSAPVTLFYLGSSIGNFSPAETREFLLDMRAHCVGRADSGILIGVDTRKAAERLLAAYDDAVGVTAAFNRNILLHVNRVVGSEFRPDDFDHRASYDSVAGRVDMHLIARRNVTVRLDGIERMFGAGERIHTESSYKYAPAEFSDLLHAAGFRSVRCWQDRDGDFAVFYAS
jgi:dimethylhistidine N-methyltransferase